MDATRFSAKKVELRQRSIAEHAAWQDFVSESSAQAAIQMHFTAASMVSVTDCGMQSLACSDSDLNHSVKNGIFNSHTVASVDRERASESDGNREKERRY